MKRILLFLCLVLSLTGWSQHYIQGSVQQGASPNSVNVNFLPSYASSPGETILYLSISIAIPTASAAGVTPALATTGPFAGINMIQASPFSYTDGTETIYSWIYDSGNSTGWTTSAFTGATITFTGGTGSTNVRLVDFTNHSPGGGNNLNTLFLVVTSQTPFDVTNYSNLFFPISGTNGSTLATYGNGDQYTQTNLPISMTAACSIPGTPVVNNITATSADISWSAAAGATGYEYVVSTSSTSPGTAPGSGTAIATTAYSANGLTAGTLYYVFIRTNCGAGNFSPWVSANFTTAAALCNAPATPAITNIGITTADISWTPVGGAVGYEYLVSTSSPSSGSGPGSAAGTGTATTGTVFNATGLTGGTTYYIYIRTNCGSGNFSQWSSNSFTTQPPLCVVPSALAVNNITTTAADISWGAISGSIGYEYVVSTNSSLPGSAPGSGTAIALPAYSATGLTAGTTYYVYVRNNCGAGSYSNWAMISFNTLCTSSSPINISAITGTSATVGWTSTGATNYEYSISTSSTAPSATPAQTSSSGTTTGTSVNVTGLTAGTIYYAYVRSSCSIGNFSEWVKLPFTTICPLPSTPVVTAITSTTASISWTGPANAQGYQYLVTTSATAPPSGNPTLSTTTPVNGLTEGTQYYVYVRTNCSPGVYSEWVYAAFTTIYPPCNAPFFVTITNIDSTATINWNAVTGTAGYEYAITTSSIPPSSGTAISQNAYEATGLNSGTDYYIHIRSYCGPGRFSMWTSRPFTTPCFKPNPFLINITPALGTADLGWRKIKGVLKYEYAILSHAAPPAGSIHFTNDTIVHAADLKPGGKYYLHVRAYCTANYISDWSVLEFHTSGLGAYANPVTGIVTIEVYGIDLGNDIAVFDTNGRLLMKTRLSGNRVTINLGACAAGVYYIRYGNGNKYTTKVLKW